jgi:glycosyltransferase involved in cell wall biosynthesis
MNTRIADPWPIGGPEEQIGSLIGSLESCMADAEMNPQGPLLKLSLVIPAYNEEKYITPTLESVARARQKFEGATGESMEVIVVDNASTDRTAEIAESFDCRVVQFDKHQIAAVRNAGAREARGEHIAFVDADRSILPEDIFIEIVANLSDPAIYGGGTRFKPDRWTVATWLFTMFFRVFCKLWGVGFVLYYMRKSDFDQLGGWNEEMYIAEDADLSFRMRRAAKASRRKILNLRGQVCVCTRKMDLLPMFPTIWRSFVILVKRDFGSADRANFMFYDVDNLR